MTWMVSPLANDPPRVPWTLAWTRAWLLRKSERERSTVPLFAPAPSGTPMLGRRSGDCVQMGEALGFE